MSFSGRRLTANNRLAGRIVAMMGLATIGLFPIHAQPSEPKPNYDVPLHGKGAYASSSDGKIYFETEGTGPPLFIIAGGPGGSHASFHPWFSELAGHFTLVYIDNIGRGRSDRLADKSGYTVERDAEDIEAVRRHLKYEQINLLGHSYGGMPAMAYSKKYGQRLNRLVLSSTLHSSDAWQQNIDSVNIVARNQYPDVWRDVVILRERGVMSAAPEYASRYGDAEGDIYWYDVEAQKRMFRSGDKRDGFNIDVYNAMLGSDPEWTVGGTMQKFDARPALGKLRTPTLVLVGRYDRVATPKVASEIKAALPEKSSQLIVFDKSGHRPWIEESTGYFAALLAFLKPAKP